MSLLPVANLLFSPEVLMELCHELDKRGHHITIETNATVFAEVAAHLISMSPKLRNSNPATDNRFFKRHERERIQPDVIRKFLDMYPCQVKFVVDTPEDLAENPNLTGGDRYSCRNNSVDAAGDNACCATTETGMVG